MGAGVSARGSIRGSKYDQDSTRVTFETVPVTAGWAPARLTTKNTKAKNKGHEGTFWKAKEFFVPFVMKSFVLFVVIP